MVKTTSLSTKEIDIAPIDVSVYPSADYRNWIRENINDKVNDLREGLIELEEKAIVAVKDIGVDKLCVDILTQDGFNKVDSLVKAFRSAVLEIEKSADKHVSNNVTIEVTKEI